jgi:hypothetical protein
MLLDMAVTARLPFAHCALAKDRRTAMTAFRLGLCPLATLMFFAMNAGAATWSPPQVLSTGGQGWEAAGAIDGNGNSVASWIEQTTSSDQIWARSEPSGGNWGAVTQIYNPTLQTNLLYPQMRVSTAGFATTIWLDGNGLWTADRPSAAPWTSPQLLSQDRLLEQDVMANFSQNPVFKMNSGGDAAIVWLTGGGSVAAVTRAAAGAWSSQQTVASPGTGTGVTLDHAAISENATVIAAWDAFQITCVVRNGRRTCHNSNFVLHASRRDPATGTWVDSGGLLGPDGSAHSSRVALDSTGRAMLVVLNTAGVFVSATQGASGGAWSAFQTAVNPGASVEGFNLASDDAGNVTLVYESLSFSVPTQSQAVAVNGSIGTDAFASPVVVSGAATDVGLVSLALAPNGNALIDWMVGGSTPEVQAAFRSTATGSWGSPLTISGPGCSSLGGSCSPEAIAVNSDGNGLVIYSGYDASQVHTEYATNFQP